MADDSKNLSNDLDDMLDDAKDGAKKANEPIINSSNELSKDANTFEKKTNQNSKDFSTSGQHSSKEFSRDVNQVANDGKTIAIISHITLIGWIIAIVMNSDKKTEFGSFYIRQVLGIMLLGLALSLIPIVNFIAWILPLVMWIMSLIASLSGEMKPVFLLGDKFQEWFKGL